VKALWIYSAFCTLVCLPAYSQLLVGPEIGVNYSWTSLRDDDLKDRFKMKPVPGFHAGGRIAFKVRNRFFLHASLLYATKGRTLTGRMDPALKSSATYSYIDMPINYTVDFRSKLKGKEFKYFLGIGPNVSYWLGGRGKFFSSELDENNEDQLSYKIKFGSQEDENQSSGSLHVEKANRLQLGLNLIAGAVFEPAYKQRFMFTVRYELGHSFLAKSDAELAGLYFEEPLKTRNKGFRVSLAYLIDLKTEERKKGKSTIDPRKPK
jgi:hypothetical protein